LLCRPFDNLQAVAETLEGLAVGRDDRVGETWDSIADWYAPSRLPNAHQLLEIIRNPVR
jgi:hypothetical protein